MKIKMMQDNMIEDDTGAHIVYVLIPFILSMSQLFYAQEIRSGVKTAQVTLSVFMRNNNIDIDNIDDNNKIIIRIIILIIIKIIICITL